MYIPEHVDRRLKHHHSRLSLEERSHSLTYLCPASVQAADRTVVGKIVGRLQGWWAMLLVLGFRSFLLLERARSCLCRRDLALVFFFVEVNHSRPFQSFALRAADT